MCTLYNSQEGIKKVSESKYISVLSKFNIGLHKPQKDDCSQCTIYRNSPKTQESEKKQAEHLLRAEMAREEKDRNKERAASDKTFVAIICDLEQVSSCPKATAQQFFYVSKVSCYNYSVYDLGTKDGTCYRWDETKSKRGASEMGSGLHHYLTQVIPKDVREVAVWADTCGGQNRNQHDVAMCQDVIEDSSNNIQSITLKYFESGHSESEVDSIHSALEKVVDGVSVYTPSAYITITELARTEQKYKVHMLGTDECPIYDLKRLSASKIKNTRDYIDSDGKVAQSNWLKAKLIYIGRSVNGQVRSPSEISLMRTFHYDEVENVIDTTKKPKSRARNKIQSIPKLQVLRDDSSDPLPISSKKLAGLMDLVRKKIIPRTWHQFYLSLNGSAVAEEDANEEEDDIDDEA